MLRLRLGSQFCFSGMEQVVFSITKIRKQGVDAVANDGKRKFSRHFALVEIERDLDSKLLNVLDI